MIYWSRDFSRSNVDTDSQFRLCRHHTTTVSHICLLLIACLCVDTSSWFGSNFMRAHTYYDHTDINEFSPLNFTSLYWSTNTAAFNGMPNKCLRSLLCFVIIIITIQRIVIFWYESTVFKIFSLPVQAIGNRENVNSFILIFKITHHHLPHWNW